MIMKKLRTLQKTNQKINKITTNYIKVKIPFYLKTLTKVNIRKLPSMDSAIIYTAPRAGIQYRITSISSNGKWGYVPYRKGWITLNKKYVQKV